MITKTILNPLLEEGFQKLNNTSVEGIVAEVTTTNATQTNIITRDIATNSVTSFKVIVTAIQSGGASGVVGNVWVYEYRGAIKNIGGTTALVDDIVSESIAEDLGTLEALSVDIAANNGTDQLEIDVVPLANHTIKWKAEIVFNELSY